MTTNVIARLRYVQKFKDRHGHVRLYLRRKGHQTVALPPQNDPGFLNAYQIALAATTPAAASRTSSGSLETLVRGYYTSAKFKQLGASTQIVYRRIIAELCRKHGTKPVVLLCTDHIQKWLDQKSDTPAAANHLLRTVRALMRYAKQTKVITMTQPSVWTDLRR